MWRTAACANRAQTDKVQQQEREIQNDEENGDQRRWPRTQAIPRSCFSRALVARRHGNRGYADFKVRGTWPWLLCEEWKTHDSTWAIPQSSRAHEQFVKTHEHFSKLMSNRWKAMSKIPRENCSWGFQNPHEPSWGLMRTHEFLMRSSWGKNSSRLFFVRESLHSDSFLDISCWANERSSFWC